MDDLQEKLNGILSDPQTMQKIMHMAQQLGSQGQTSAPEPPPSQDSSASFLPDPSMLQKLASLAGQSTVDRDQQGLLRALGPYLSRHRLTKLERAMRAARMASMATNLLGQTGNSGR